MTKKFELSPTDRKILSFVHTKGELIYKEIAAEVNLPVHAVRNSINRLWDAGIISYKPFIDFLQLGLTEFGFFINLKNNKSLKKILTALAKEPTVYFTSTFSGQADLLVITLCQKLDENLPLINRIKERFANELNDFNLIARTGVTHYSIGCLSPNRHRTRDFLRYGTGQRNFKPSSLQLKILDGLGSLKEKNILKLAEQIDVPHTTIRYQLNILEKQKVYLGSFYVIQFDQLGFDHHRILLKLKGAPIQLAARLHQFILPYQNVYTLIETLGAWDFEINLLTENPQELKSFINALKQEFSKELLFCKILTIDSFSNLSFRPIYHTYNLAE